MIRSIRVDHTDFFKCLLKPIHSLGQDTLHYAVWHTYSPAKQVKTCLEIIAAADEASAPARLTPDAQYRLPNASRLPTDSCVCEGVGAPEGRARDSHHQPVTRRGDGSPRVRRPHRYDRILARSGHPPLGLCKLGDSIYCNK